MTETEFTWVVITLLAIALFAAIISVLDRIK
jgi:hypothetical protein